MRNRIRELRERARLTQAELATLLEVSENDVSRWECSKRPLSPATIEKLAAVFKVGSWELFLDRKGLRQLVAASSVAPEVNADDTAEGSRVR
jgi:transcriptional regulator with XRE-family HTH domain